MRVIKPPVASSAWEKYLPRAITTVPPGFQTSREIAQLLCLSESHAAKQLGRLVELGTVQVIKVKLPGRRNPVPHYRPSDYEAKDSTRSKHRRNR